MDHKETGWQGVEWIDLAQDMNKWQDAVNAAINIRFAQIAGNFLTS
jgi:hypothetical protein